MSVDLLDRGLAELPTRTTEGLEMTALAALTARERRALVGSRTIPRGYHVVRSSRSRIATLRVVGGDVATLLRSFRKPTARGSHRTWRGNIALPRVVARFVCDGLLEVRGRDGWVNGASAHALVFTRGAERRAAGAGHLAVQALQYAQSLVSNNARDVAQHLYDFNRLPETSQWRSRLAGPAAVRAFLGVSGSGKVARLLRSHWLSQHTPRRGAPWLMWRSLAPVPAPDGHSNYKVYVSPALDALPEAFDATVCTLARIGAPEFKVGRHLWGVLRPDKLVIYFTSRREMEGALRALRAALRGVPGHGVPFSAAVDDTGLLSWGVDPPRDLPAAAIRGTESWRRWVAVQLAAYLCAAKAQPGTAVEPWVFALDRLALDGVDVRRWVLASAPASAPASRKR